MNVRELIFELSKYNPETLVVISGYESGYTENIGIREETIALNVNESPWYGQHESVMIAEMREYYCSEEDNVQFERANAIIISR